ncbi:GTP pyrophosphokinase YwaC [Corynebacterium occultum]|uniref:GTP pyrophosphokinase YwaC n=1 Tax=Corynebacterium occultum TaxID=2675219 RepID=A0A6B8W768_9CORY|nr:GTP pyrophosphokinase family protein [Corynebacterium occultum]QGU07767.1 GTP pyrophosphokinase YwaC [Corynebacterium occultum]
MNNKVISRLGSYYHAWARSHPDAAEEFSGALEDLLSDGGVTYDRVWARVKEWSSLKAKARKQHPDGSPQYPEPWQDIHDVVGVRVTTYHSTEIPAAITVLRDSFLVHRNVDKTTETRVSGTFGYGSHHLILEVSEDSPEELRAYRGMRFEVQIRTVLQHAWAEFEHDIRYKRGPEEPDPAVDRAFTLAAGLIELADQQFDLIASVQSSGASTTDDEVELSSETLPGVLAVLLGNRFPRPRSELFRWLGEILLANGVTTVAELRLLLDDMDIEALGRAMNYRFLPGQVRLIDDLLLRRYGDDHISRTRDSSSRATQRERQLKTRLAKMRRAHITAEKG